MSTEYSISETIEGGIERIVYTPAVRAYRTPILMQHGMWHGAWSWEPWQKLFAEWGWESHAYSLPGHGRSPKGRPARLCTLGYYDRFLAAEVARMSVLPIVMGHSMGGALVQRYLTFSGDLPAGVLVSSWPSRSTLLSTLSLFRRHPREAARTVATLSPDHGVRTSELVGKFFLSEGALITPEELLSRLCPESFLVALQHQPPFWRPRLRTQTPLLWLGGTHDYLNAEPLHEASAADFGADYFPVEGANHDIMWERSSAETAEAIHHWLAGRGLS